MILEAADANLVLHATWVQSRLPAGRVESSPALVVGDSGLPCDTFNLVCRARLDQPARHAVEGVLAYFARVGRPFSWWHGPADRPSDLDRVLLGAGLTAAESELAMAADLRRLRAAHDIPPGLRIVRARTHRAIADFACVSAANWTPPDPHVLRFYELAAPLLLGSDCPLRLYVGYLGDEPIATAELDVSEGAVGLYNIATVAAHRGRGIGTAMTLRPLLDAREEGHTLAVLQASGEGQGLYARLGFEEQGRYTEYQRNQA
jgi:ribosomal protein S18 acetylase RimI-like enzyme